MMMVWSRILVYIIEGVAYEKEDEEDFCANIGTGIDVTFVLRTATIMLLLFLLVAQTVNFP